MIKFYYSLAPNPMKVALMLEELGLPYELVAVDTRKGDQLEPAFLALNPNGRVPVIVDGETMIFDSNAILLYLGEKAGQFVVGSHDPLRGPFLSWLMFIATGIGPYSGQSVHFQHYAPKGMEYGVKRYAFEAKRHWGVVEAHLANNHFMLGDEYTIVDMALWGWTRALTFIFGKEAAQFVNVARLMAEIDARPAAMRAVSLKDRHRFKTEMDDEARRVMFRHVVTA